MSRKEIIIGLLIAVTLAVFASPFASSFPDGLEKVAERFGFLEKGEGREVIESPVPDYAMPGIGDERIATAVAGGVGTLVVFGLGYGAARLLKRKREV